MIIGGDDDSGGSHGGSDDDGDEYCDGRDDVDDDDDYYRHDDLRLKVREVYLQWHQTNRSFRPDVPTNYCNCYQPRTTVTPCSPF